MDIAAESDLSYGAVPGDRLTSVCRFLRPRGWELKEGANMFRRWFVDVTVIVGILSIPLPGTGANAAEIKVLSAVAMKPALDDLAPEFERRTGHTVKMAYATAGIVRDRVRDGESLDVAILPRSAFDPPADTGQDCA
jgi:hypothetical protein